MADLTDMEIRTVSAITRFHEINQKSPSYEELALMVGTSSSTIWRRVQDLIRKGIVIVEEGRHRTISLVPTEYPVWKVEKSDGRVLIISCETEDRAIQLARASGAHDHPGSHVINVTKMSLNLAEIEAKTKGNFELVARVDRSIN